VEGEGVEEEHGVAGMGEAGVEVVEIGPVDVRDRHGEEE
jgi:hypothetical protein